MVEPACRVSSAWPCSTKHKAILNIDIDININIHITFKTFS